MRMDGQVYFDRKLSVQLLQRSGRNWKYEDREENIILDPSRRSLMMRHIAENKNDPTLLDTMNQVNNRGQIAVRMRERGVRRRIRRGRRSRRSKGTRATAWCCTICSTRRSSRARTGISIFR